MRKLLRKRGRYRALPAATKVPKPRPAAAFREAVERVEQSEALPVGELRASSHYRSRRMRPIVTIGLYTVAMVVLAAVWVYRGEILDWAGREAEGSVAATAPTAPLATTPSPTTMPDPAEVIEQLRVALANRGFDWVSASVEDGTLLLTGVIPAAGLEDGVFAFVGSVTAVAESASAGLPVTTRMTLRGDAGRLGEDLRALTDQRPITFEGGSEVLGETDQETLKLVAELINDQPGLSVLIAGHTDAPGSAAQNQELARRRGVVVFEYLVSQGVAPNRLSVVSYGEMFPEEGGDPNRRIEFEVGL